jgi:hypothetical protein
MAKENPVEVEQKRQIEALEGALTEIRNRHETTAFELQERMVELDRIMGGQENWIPLLSYGDEGPSIEQLVTRAKQIRVAVTLNPHVKRGAKLRSSYVWSDQIDYSGIPGMGEPAGRGQANVGARVDDPINQRYVFSALAREEREMSLYTDGGFILIGDETDKTLRPMPITQISGMYTNDEDPSEVWAYRRLWYTEGGLKPNVEWIFTDLFKSKTTSEIVYNGVTEPVNRRKTIIDGWVNTQPGWALGFPDAGCIVEWARIYSEFIKSGKLMTDAMARIWAVAKAQSSTGAAAVATKLGGGTGFGNVAVGNELAPLATAGKAYDFDAGRALISIVATGIEVSVIHLTSDPGASGSSYGSAATLDLPTRLAVEARRRWHEQYEERVLRWLGARNPRAKFPPIVDGAELYRKTQAVVLKWQTGLYTPEQVKNELQLLMGDPMPSDIPDGVLIPNNEYSAQRADIDMDVAAMDDSMPTVASPDQGQDNGTGSLDALGMDLRDDTIS